VAPELKPDYEKLCANWRGDEAEATRRARGAGDARAQICVAYAAVFSVLSWDFIMALTPDWVSTLFGWWFIMGCFLTGIAMTALLATQLARQVPARGVSDDAPLLGHRKIMFGICIFWVYQMWAQYLPICTPTCPMRPVGCSCVRRALATLCVRGVGLVFVIPFLGLLNKTTKTTPFWLALFALIVLSGMWLDGMCW